MLSLAAEMARLSGALVAPVRTHNQISAEKIWNEYLIDFRELWGKVPDEWLKVNEVAVEIDKSHASTLTFLKRMYEDGILERIERKDGMRAVLKYRWKGKK